MLSNRTRHLPRARYLPQAIALGASALIATSVLAQGQIEEVVVTAQKRVESQQEVPIAITTLSSATIEKQGIYNFTDIVKTVPSLSETAYPSSNMLILYMRGQGVSDPMQVTADGSVGLYVDGHYIARPQGALFDIADAERVEVLRGPQGTLYGRNTTGGAINLVTRKPSGEFGFKQNLSMGSRDFVRSLSVIDLPEVGGVSSKVSILSKKEDGYVKNLGNSHDYGETDEIAGRVALHWSPAEHFDVDYALDVGSQDSTPIYYASTRPTNPYYAYGFAMIPGYIYGNDPTGHTYRPIDLPRSNLDFEGHGLTLTWEATEHLTIKSLTSYRQIEFDAYQDYAEAFGIPGHSWDGVNNHQFAQEFQFIGDVGDSINYVAGLFYFKEKSNHQQIWVMDLTGVPSVGINSVKDRDTDAESKSHAAYAQVTWTPPILDDKLDLTLGARFTKDKRGASRNLIVDVVPPTGSPIPELALSAVKHSYRPNRARLAIPGYSLYDIASNKQTSSRFNPAFTANYSWTDTINTYAKVSTGYKAGGSSEGAPPGLFNSTYSAEDVTTYELGLKSDWLDRSLRVNAAVFYSKFEDMQLVFVADATDASLTMGYNAGKANVTGAELEVTWLPTTDLMFNINYAYLDPKFDTVDVIPGTIFDPAVNPASPYTLGSNIKDLFVLPYAPRDTVFVSMDYTFWHLANGDVSLNLNYHHQSDNYISAPAGSGVPGRENYRQDAYGVMDARITLNLDLPDDRNLQLALWGHNITNREYRNSLIGQGGPGAVAVGYQPAGYSFAATSWAPPPSYGAEVIFTY